MSEAAFDAVQHTVAVTSSAPTPADELRKVLIPKIRHIMPSVIASELMGTQPMSVDWEWYYRKQNEERKLNALMEQYPEIKEAKDKLDILIALHE